MTRRVDGAHASRLDPAWRRGAGRTVALALVAGAVGGAAIGGAVIGSAAPADAHNYLIASTPAIGATLTSAPRTYEITTNDRLLDIGGSNSGFAFRVVGPDGRYHEDGCVDVDGPSMTTRASLGASGTYTVEWQIVSADGHTVSDDYTFRWEAPASSRPARGTTSPATCAAGSSGSAAASGGSGSGSGAAQSGGDRSGSIGSSSSSAGGPSTAAAAGSASSTVVDALWIGAGGLVVIALIVTVLLLLRRPADTDANEHDDDARD